MVSPIVEFLYLWLLRPQEASVIDKDGSFIKKVLRERRASELLVSDGTWGRMPSGRRMDCKDTCEFVEKYIQ